MQCVQNEVSERSQDRVSAEDNEKNAGRILWSLLLLQLLIYIDRGVLPGCSREINIFIRQSTGTARPDMFLGVLQSAFIIGLSIACPVVAHLSIRRSVPVLTAVGVLIWAAGEVLTFLAAKLRDDGGYFVLLVARSVTGVGEAALLSLVPPLVLRSTGKNSGWWLGVFCSVIPVGVALGFMFGSFAGSHPLLGWNGAYLVLALVSLPLILYNYLVGRRQESAWRATSVPVASQNDVQLSLAAHAFSVLREPRFLWICVAYAAYAATVTSFSTFGPAFMLDTQVVRSEAVAASTLGLVVGLAGVIGSLFGGSLLTEAERRRAPVPLAQWLLSFRSPALPVTYSAREPPLSVLQSFVVHEDDDRDVARSDRKGQEEEPRHQHCVDPEAGENYRDTSEAVQQAQPTAEAELLVVQEVSEDEEEKLANYLSSIIPVLGVAVGLFAALPWIPFQVPFLLVLGVALSALFSAQVAFNLCGMLAVPDVSRPCAVALMTLFLHVAGDVPAPLLVGLLKDELAPHCIPPVSSASSSVLAGAGEVAAGVAAVWPTEECLAESTQVRLTEQICGLWLLWTLFGICKARNMSAFRPNGRR